MEKIFGGQWWLLIGIGIAFVCSILCQVFLARYLLRMVKESGNLEDTKPELLADWIEKYLKKEEQITDINVFLEKEFHKFRIGRFTIIELKHFSGQALMLMIFLTGVGACRGIMDGKTLGEILPFYIISMFGLYIHFSIAGFINFEENKKTIYLNIMDFLKNKKSYHYQTIKGKEEKRKDLLAEEQALELHEMIREILV